MKWTPVKNPPKEKGYYLCWIEKCPPQSHPVQAIKWDGEYWYVGTGDVSHWMQLPEKPKEVIMAMTWLKFVAEVERIMERDGISKDTEIDYIDVTSPEPEGDADNHGLIFVSDGPNGYLSISS